MKKLATTILGSLVLTSIGAAGCAPPMLAEESGSSASNIEGESGAFEINAGRGVRVNPDLAVFICSDEAPDAAKMAAAVVANVSKYADDTTTGIPLIIHGDTPENDRFYITDVPQLGPGGGSCAGDSYRVNIHSSDEQFIGEIKNAAKLALTEAFAYDFGKVSCELGGEVSRPFLEWGTEPWGPIDGTFVPPDLKVGWRGPVEAQGGISCEISIPVPLPQLKWAHPEIKLSLGIAYKGEVGGDMEASASSRNGATVKTPNGAVEYKLGIALELRPLKLFTFTVGIDVATVGYSCASGGKVTFTVKGRAAFDPKLTGTKLTKNWGVEGSHDTEFTLNPMCEAPPAPIAPPIPPQPETPSTGDDCADGILATQLRFCGRSPGTEHTLYRCEAGQWHEAQSCTEGCMPNGRGEDYCY